jgi:hypothetical protein
MKDFDSLLNHAKERVQATETPLSLYAKAERRKNLIDGIVTGAIASLLILVFVSSQTPAPTLKIQAPAVKEYIQNEIVAMGGSR